MLIYGSGGHSKVVIDCTESEGFQIEGIFDDFSNEKSLLNIPILGKYNPNIQSEKSIIIAVGDNKLRKKMSESIKHSFGKVIHPSAIISKYSQIDEGSVVFQNTVIQAGSKIGKHCIINTSASIDHDNVLEDFVHISPNATLSGTVHVGEGTWIGSGATVINNVNIGKWCIIGAGSVITKDIPDYALVMGIPGKKIKNLNL